MLFDPPKTLRPVGEAGLWCDDRPIERLGPGQGAPWDGYRWLRTAGRTAWPSEVHQRVAYATKCAHKRTGRAIQHGRSILAQHWPELRHEPFAFDPGPGAITPAAGLGAIALAAWAICPDGRHEATHAPLPERVRQLPQLYVETFGAGRAEIDDAMDRHIASGTVARWRRLARRSALSLLWVVWNAALRSDVEDWSRALDRGPVEWAGPERAAAAEYVAELHRAAAEHVRRSERVEPAQLALPIPGVAA